MRKLIQIGLCFVCALSLCACSATPELKKQTFTIELGQDVYANPSLYVKNANSRMEVRALSTGIRKKRNRFVTANMNYLVCGMYRFEIVSGSQTVTFHIKIKDTKAPTVSKSPDSITVTAGETIDWDSYFHASDLSGVEYTSDPAIETASTSEEVQLKISDRFGNSTTRTVQVNVN
ncbi:hypothetical protein [Catenisphaera adipataccumulans]|jgi:hypothetical protein|uniref:Plastocyanin n=1 Tax=Catenisphaera adipataccumulans TaxID=700500 RepID=A0A7W8CZL2_9FIRM|nr:hypothetical protein [Catenisphaera adipataccumulans]MBB5182870.1 plastocyanin [Catenisphaera adipataccumulans]